VLVLKEALPPGGMKKGLLGGKRVPEPVGEKKLVPLWSVPPAAKAEIRGQ
jgi:hypothetical protein